MLRVSSDSLPPLSHHLLRALGHLPIPGIHAVVWQLLRLHDKTHPDEYLVDFHGLQYRGRLDDFIDQSIFLFGSYAPNELDFLATTARVLRLYRKEITFFDIGANVGQYALFMSQHADTVVAFEPSEKARERFRINLALNNIANIRVFPFALGDCDGEGDLGSGFAGNSGSKSLNWTLYQTAIERVSIRHGDRLFEEENLPGMAILKLDVEGYEKRVLEGLRRTLIRDRPIILMELIGPSEKSGFADEADLHENLYPHHALFTLGGRRKSMLLPFDWNSEALVCMPDEIAHQFSSVIIR